jgi:hypothetical protein
VRPVPGIAGVDRVGPGGAYRIAVLVRDAAAPVVIAIVAAGTAA